MDADADPVLTPDDIRRAGYCTSGFMEWLAHYGIDSRRFFRGEVRASEFLATGDANGIRVVTMKKDAADGA